MKKIFAAMVAALLMVSLVSSTAFASAPKWTVWQYDSATGNGPYPLGVANPHASTATFAFDASMDQALLTSTASQYMKKGNLLGKSMTATISITPPAGYTGTYTFSAYSDAAQGCNSTQAIVRFYFSTKLVLGPETTFQPGLYADQMWWSNVSIPLAVLYANGPTTLSVTFAAANWFDLNGKTGDQVGAVYGNQYAADFNTAASNVDRVGFSFGSPDCAAFGDGSTPAGALFNLLQFSIY